MGNQSLHEDLTPEEADQLYERTFGKHNSPQEPPKTKVEEGLKYEMYGKPGEDAKWLRLYECEHLTAGTMPLDNDHSIIHLGDHHSVLLCRHCASHMVGMISYKLVGDVIKSKPLPEVMEFLKAGKEAFSQQRENDQAILNKIAEPKGGA